MKTDTAGGVYGKDQSPGECRVLCVGAPVHAVLLFTLAKGQLIALYID